MLIYQQQNPIEGGVFLESYSKEGIVLPFRATPCAELAQAVLELTEAN